jgi:hypothetical protein
MIYQCLSLRDTMIYHARDECSHQTAGSPARPLAASPPFARLWLCRPPFLNRPFWRIFLAPAGVYHRVDSHLYTSCKKLGHFQGPVRAISTLRHGGFGAANGRDQRRRSVVCGYAFPPHLFLMGWIRRSDCTSMMDRLYEPPE